jgi:hypothetical protein
MITQEDAMDFVEDQHNSNLSNISSEFAGNAQRLLQLNKIGNMSKMGSSAGSDTKGHSSMSASKIKKKQKNPLLQFFCLFHSSQFPVVSEITSHDHLFVHARVRLRRRWRVFVHHDEQSQELFDPIRLAVFSLDATVASKFAEYP